MAGMPKRRSHCKRCNRPDTVAGRMSARGLCEDCGRRAVIENVQAMQTGQGDTAERWRRQWAAGMSQYLQELQQRMDAEWQRREQAHRNSAL